MPYRRIHISTAEDDPQPIMIETTVSIDDTVSDQISDADWDYVTRCAKVDAEVTLAELRAFLTKKNVNLGAGPK